MRFLLILALALAGQDTKPTPLPKVRPLSGDLVVWRSGANRTETIRKESGIAYGDRLGTARGEPASFALGGEELVSLKGVVVGKGKGLALEWAAENLVLKLYDGKITVESFRTEIAVETPTGTVRGKGAFFFIEVTSEKVRVVALDGELSFANTLGTVKVLAGQETEAGPEAAPSEPKAADMAKVTREIGEPGPNLVANPGYELELRGWKCEYGNNKNYVSSDPSVVHSGRRSLAVDVQPRHFDGSRDGAPLSQALAVKPGRRYLVRCYLRVQTTRGTIVPGICALGTVEIQDGKNGRWIQPAMGESWSMARVVVTAKDSTLAVSVNIAMRGDDFAGTVWADDWFVMELPN